MNKSSSPRERLAMGPELLGLVTREAFHGAKGPQSQSSAFSLQMPGGEGKGGFLPPHLFCSGPCDCFNQQNTAKYCSMTSEARQITTSPPFALSSWPSFVGPGYQDPRKLKQPGDSWGEGRAMGKANPPAAGWQDMQQGPATRFGLCPNCRFMNKRNHRCGSEFGSIAFWSGLLDSNRKMK